MIGLSGLLFKLQHPVQTFLQFDVGQRVALVSLLGMYFVLYIIGVVGLFSRVLNMRTYNLAEAKKFENQWGDSILYAVITFVINVGYEITTLKYQNSSAAFEQQAEQLLFSLILANLLFLYLITAGLILSFLSKKRIRELELANE